MPSHEEHCEHSEEIFGYRFSEVHTYIDEPVKVLGPKHRIVRHDIKRSPQIIASLKCWDNIIPEEYKKYIPDVVEQHILDDLKVIQKSFNETSLDAVKTLKERVKQWSKQNKDKQECGNAKIEIRAKLKEDNLNIMLLNQMGAENGVRQKRMAEQISVIQKEGGSQVIQDYKNEFVEEGIPIGTGHNGQFICYNKDDYIKSTPTKKICKEIKNKCSLLKIGVELDVCSKDDIFVFLDDMADTLKELREKYEKL